MKNIASLYDDDHKVGMEVPEGGSNCDKCGHLSGPQTCDDKEFIEWNGSAAIPEKTSRYCCDFFKVGHTVRKHPLYQLKKKQ